MAALTHTPRPRVRAAAPGEGAAIAALWRELWEAHEEWGGYPGSRDARVYSQLAQRLDDDARVRAGSPILGRHIHLVAEIAGAPAGQVEGWFDRQGGDVSTPFTCEVRSLVVTRRARGLGAGRALLDGLADAARTLAQGGPCVLAAEVLERNPAHAFYERVGYAPVAWNAQIEASKGAIVQPGTFGARLAGPRDALFIARLEMMLAPRLAGVDARYDRPRALDATFVGAIAAHLASEVPASLREPAMLVATDSNGAIRGAASFTVHSLEPPFVPMRRALLGRFALDARCPAVPVVLALVGLGCKVAVSRGAPQVELIDLSPPETELHDAALAIGARAWSRLLTRDCLLATRTGLRFEP
ncbi:MAG: GNAT family N-acetyltransferase [Myxococcota bacterium]|nr:GNAT family N-acetyltransferase [Myxococcota bacterium]